MYVECPLVKINYTFVLAPSKCFVTGWDWGGGVPHKNERSEIRSLAVQTFEF